MRYRDIIRAIIESDATGNIEPIAPSEPRKESDAYQTRQTRPKKRARWQTPPVPKPPEKS